MVVEKPPGLLEPKTLRVLIIKPRTFKWRDGTMCCTASLECGTKTSAVHVQLIFEEEVFKALPGRKAIAKCNTTRSASAPLGILKCVESPATLLAKVDRKGEEV